MGKKEKSKGSGEETLSVLRSLFSDDNPFRRKDPPQCPSPSPRPPLPAAAELGLGLSGRDEDRAAVDVLVGRKRKPEKAASGSPKMPRAAGDAQENPEVKKMRKKRKRDDVEEDYERKRYGEAPEEEEVKAVAVGEKRKSADVVSLEISAPKESFDDESKLLRTIFVGNLPLRTKRKALLKEFAQFGEIESIRIRSVPIVDSKVPRKGAIMEGKVNEAIDSVHAYIVFKEEQSASASLSHNMTQFGGNHIRVDMACPPRKKLKGVGPLYDRKRTIFVGNLPFDVKDEELYQLFCGTVESESSLEAIRVIRDPNSSLGKGIAYVLFRTRDVANSISKRKDLKIRDRLLRVCHAKASDVTPSKRKDRSEMETPRKETPRKKFVVSADEHDKPKIRTPTPSYQGVRSSKTGKNYTLRPKATRDQKSGMREMMYPKTRKAKSGMREMMDPMTRKAKSGMREMMDPKTRKAKRPAVAARKAKQLLKKRKQENGTPESTHKNKKARRA